MGCTSSYAEEPQFRVIPVQSSQINNFVDQLPLIVLQKLNEKFNYYCNKSSQLPLEQFIIMHLTSFHKARTGYQSQEGIKTQEGEPSIIKLKEISQALLIRLYQFYTDMDNNKLKFRSFISKYSIVTKSSEQIFAQIIYFINTGINNKQTALKIKDNNAMMTIKQFDSFVLNNKKYFGFIPEGVSDENGEKFISKDQFREKLKQSGFFYSHYRSKFALFHKDDFPFEQISRKLIEMDICDFDTGQTYYIISSKWFEQWSFYYQGATDFMSASNFKSTKLINSKKSQKKRRPSKNHYSINKSSRDIDLDQNMWLAQKPRAITFDDIEGQFYGQIKQNIRSNYEIKVISLEIWQLFKKTMNSQGEIWRVASSPTTLQLYPKMIYFLQTNKQGTIDDKSFKIVQASLKTRLRQIHSLAKGKKKQQQDKGQVYYFIKDFGQDNWIQQDKDRVLGRCSTETRFFVVETHSKVGFLQKYTRKQKKLDNIAYGDKIFAYFAYKKQITSAYVIRIPEDKKLKVHYADTSYKYEVEINVSEVSINEQLCSTLSETLRKSIENFSYKGIKNIGNTCFINAIVQCLIATPVFDDYITTQKFNSKTQPLLYQISLIAKDLLVHQKISPNQLKKTIDMQLSLFSGNDQHDAQQFLSFLLDKFNSELKTQNKSQQQSKTVNVIDQLFGGTTLNTLICKKCRNISKSQERISIVSLPIPQPQFNTFVIYVFPVYYKKIRKIMFRLHHTSTLHQYLNCFQERTGQTSQDFIFTQNNSTVGKKVRKDFLDGMYLDKKLQDLGITPNIQIFCYERIRKNVLSELAQQNKDHHKHSQYFDFFDQSQKKWIYGRYLDKQSRKKIEVKQIQQPFKVSTIKLKTNLIQNQEIAPLGLQTQQYVFKKLYMRKYNTALSKMENFGFSLMVSYPKIVTCNQLCKLINICLQNYVQNQFRKGSEKPYYIRFLQINNQKCIFCGKTELKYEKQELRMCCRPLDSEKNIPLFWLTKQTNYMVYLQWFNFAAYNMQFSSILEVDPLSAAVQKQKTNDKTHIQECLKLLQQPQTVQMSCDQCKHGQQQRKQTMKHVPNILILHMKEFRVTSQQMLIKLDINLKWIQYLDISEFSDNSKGCIYELYAYVRHTGTSSSGHYTCVARRKHLFQNKKIWVNFDDDLTQTVQQEQKNIDSAYLLFFKKVDIPNSTYLNFSNFQTA